MIHTTLVPFFSSRSTTQTFAPSFAKSNEEALPIPDPPPVIKAVFPCNLWLTNVQNVLLTIE